MTHRANFEHDLFPGAFGERAMLLGGSVAVESRPGAGTTVVARVPLARAAAPTEAA